MAAKRATKRRAGKRAPPRPHNPEVSVTLQINSEDLRRLLARQKAESIINGPEEPLVRYIPINDPTMDELPRKAERIFTRLDRMHMVRNKLFGIIGAFTAGLIIGGIFGGLFVFVAKSFAHI